MTASHRYLDLLTLFDPAQRAAQARLQLSNANFVHVVTLAVGDHH
jgi:hypothetical protein